jgi:hypothetical protein
MTASEPNPADADRRPYRGATEDVPPPSREVSLRDAAFWLEELEAAMERIEDGRATARDRRVMHEGPLVAQRLLTFAQFGDRERWHQEHAAVARVVLEARAEGTPGAPLDDTRAAAEAAQYRPDFERASRDLEVLRLRLTPS